MKAVCPLAVVALFTASTASSQAAGQRVEFEVASVRHSPAGPPGQGGVGLHMDGSQVRIAYFLIRDYVAMAYGVRSNTITGPDWIATERFDLNAKLPAASSGAKIPDMLQAFLADRFQLKVHREKKEMPVYAIVQGKAPLKLKESVADTADSEPKGTVNMTAGGSATGVSANLGNGSYYTFANNKFEAVKVSMDTLVRIVEAYLDRPVLNRTDLKGNYDLTLNLTPEDYQAMLIRAALNNGVVLPPQALAFLDAGSAASLFDAVEKLGLKLDARKEPMDTIVIDQISKTPTDN